MATRRILVVQICQYCGKEFTTRTNKQYCSRQCASLNTVASGRDTLCWKCKKATAGEDCPWANDFIPVEGWEATQSTLAIQSARDHRREEISYKVNKCPLFKEG